MSKAQSRENLLGCDLASLKPRALRIFLLRNFVSASDHFIGQRLHLALPGTARKRSAGRNPQGKFSNLMLPCCNNPRRVRRCAAPAIFFRSTTTSARTGLAKQTSEIFGGVPSTSVASISHSMRTSHIAR